MPSGCVRSAQVIYYSSDKPCIPTIERVVGKSNYRIGVGFDDERGLFKNRILIVFDEDNPQVVSTVLRRLVNALKARDFVIVVGYWDGRFRLFEGRVPSPGEL